MTIKVGIVCVLFCFVFFPTHLTLDHEHVKARPEVDVTVLGDSLRARAIPRQHEHQGSLLAGTAAWPAGSVGSRQVVRVKSDVVAEAVGSDAESQGCPAVHGGCEGHPRQHDAPPP